MEYYTRPDALLPSRPASCHAGRSRPARLYIERDVMCIYKYIYIYLYIHITSLSIYRRAGRERPAWHEAGREGRRASGLV